jgi:hypothetical protein
VQRIFPFPWEQMKPKVAGRPRGGTHQETGEPPDLSRDRRSGFRYCHGHERLEFQQVLLPDALDVHQLFELFVEDSRRNVYAGELEVRPPGAPTTGPGGSGVVQPLATAQASLDGCLQTFRGVAKQNTLQGKASHD